MKLGNTIKYLLVFLPFAFSMASCDVHEFPKPQEKLPFILNLHFDTDWEVQEEILTKQRSALTQDIRYVIKVFPQDVGSRTAYVATEIFTFLRSARDGYDCSFTLDIPKGEYDVRVWADLVEPGTENDRFYNTSDFSRIALQGEYSGNTDERDAFRGSCRVNLISTIYETSPDEYTVEMQRPLAKFEFISTDIDEFVDKVLQEEAASRSNSQTESESRSDATRSIIEDYRVVFYYTGFMPDVFNIFTDKPVDSATGVSFESSIRQLNETEASLGFDYVFINSHSTTGPVAGGLMDAEGNVVAMSNTIDVPISRSFHTIVRGKFLTQKASEGVTINPDFDGEHNMVIP